MYDLIEKYANIMYDRNLKSFGTLVTVNDIISEVYAIGFNSRQDVIKNVRDIIFKEKRTLLASIQHRQQRDLTGNKRCHKCGETKHVSEFYERFDKRNGFRYLSNCKECERIRRFEYNSKKRNEKNRQPVRPSL